MTDISSVLSQIRPREVTQTISLRDDLVGRIRDLGEAVKEALAFDQDHNQPDTAPAVREELEKVVADYEAGKVTFRFRALPHDQWMTLLAKHQPTDIDKAADRDYDSVTFPIAAMAACCVEPDGVTEAKIRELAEVLPHGPFQALFEACMSANLALEDESIPFSAAVIDRILDSVSSSTTAAAEESPTASSPDE